MRAIPIVRSSSFTLTLLGVLCGLLLLTHPLLAWTQTPTPPPMASFAQCLADLKQQAHSDHGQGQEIEQFFSLITQVPQVIAADRKQAEFTQSFATYYGKRVTQTRIDKGRKLKATHAELFNHIAQRFHVHPSYLLALWGLETNFGSYMGNLTIPSALATLACDTRRSDFFQSQLMAAVEVAVRGDIDATQMVGSWAGAMGHMQFMPTTYLEFAIDHDGDGKANVYQSIDDAMASAANYLQSIGWQAGFRWGREVSLPEHFDYSQASQNNWQPLSHWRTLGVRDISGQLVAPMDLSSAIVLPTGHTGPAFLVYPNFKVLMKWNRSVNYALAVGRLADRIAGLGTLTTPFPDEKNLRFKIEDLKTLQTILTQQGFDTQGVDGVLGPATRKAIREFQKSKGLTADGFPNTALFSALGI